MFLVASVIMLEIKLHVIGLSFDVPVAFTDLVLVLL